MPFKKEKPARGAFQVDLAMQIYTGFVPIGEKIIEIAIMASIGIAAPIQYQTVSNLFLNNT